MNTFLKLKIGVTYIKNSENDKTTKIFINIVALQVYKNTIFQNVNIFPYNERFILKESLCIHIIYIIDI